MAPSVLIAGLSGRALAEAARYSGYAPLVADLFCDADTRAVAEQAGPVEGGIARGLRRRPLLVALERLAAGRAPVGLVYASGFEDRPRLLHALAGRYTLLGNSAETVRRVKDPLVFAAICARVNIPHPAIRLDQVPAEKGWLVKRRGGAGGWHIHPARPGRKLSPRCYAQRHVPGRPISALFLGDGHRSMVLGFSTQWSDPAPRQPVRYGGAVQPALTAPDEAARMTEAVARLTKETGLAGLNSADFLLSDSGFHLLEVNPRPGATLDIFRDPAVFRLHVDACRGHLPATPPVFAPAAAALVYAPTRRQIGHTADWPDWVADRPQPGSILPAGAPVCTVRAEAEDAEAARRLVEQRRTAVLTLAEEYA